MHRTPGVTAELINPDERDLSETAKYADALGLRQRCNLRNLLINKVPFNSESFDIITCVSVLEHIPESNFAIRKMWDLLRPGGKLIITLPCMAEATEQYISESEYGLLQRGQDGYTFWQLYYDQTLLEQKIFSIIGSPSKMSIYGERKPGSFARTAYQKRSGGVYPFWREPYMMGNEYSYFTTVNDLPGEGVVAMEFMKI
jgi:predicted SAM-dependent methyltransferase